MRACWLVWIACAAASVCVAPAQSPNWSALDRQAEELYTKGDLKEAIRVAKLARDAATAPPEAARSLDRLGFFEYTAGSLAEGEAHLRESLELRKALGTETAAYAESANDLAL